MSAPVRLTDTQRGVLRSFVEYGDGWPGQGWTWGSHSACYRIMCALEKKGWVLRQEMTGQQYAPGSYRFTITEAGRRRLEQQE